MPGTSNFEGAAPKQAKFMQSKRGKVSMNAASFEMPNASHNPMDLARDQLSNVVTDFQKKIGTNLKFEAPTGKLPGRFDVI